MLHAIGDDGLTGRKRQKEPWQTTGVHEEIILRDGLPGNLGP
jgi:hypothetical protein